MIFQIQTKMQTILSLDTQITHILSYLLPHNDFFEVLFTFLSLEGNYFFIWALALGAVFLFGGKRNWKFLGILLITLSITLGLVDLVFKPLFQRDRPYMVQQVDTLVCPRDYSFPSGHAAGSFAGATVLTWFDKKRRNLYYIGAFLISYSRVFLECHYVFDVVIGALFGFLMSKGILHFTSHSKLKPMTKRN